MQKVYLLLRNNHQTGPYTIDELLQQQLTAFDLVWVEGVSQAWSYPSELAELKEFFVSDANKKAVPLQQPASTSVDEIERRAEELRQRVLSFPSKYIVRKIFKEDDVSVDALRAMAEERIEFVDHRKKESPVFEWMSAAMVTLIVAAGVYGGARFFNSEANFPPTVVTKSVSIDNHAGKVVATPIPQHAVAMQEETMKDTVTKAVAINQKPIKSPKRRRINIEALPATAIERMSVPEHTGDETSSAVEAPKELKKEVIEPEPRTIVTEEPVEKKKPGLFKGLFKKKKKNEVKPEEQEGNTAQSQGS
jgi:hypothetical protein